EPHRFRIDRDRFAEIEIARQVAFVEVDLHVGQDGARLLTLRLGAVGRVDTGAPRGKQGEAATYRAAFSRYGRRNSRMSRANCSGCSSAAKCPPRGISVQRCALKKRSAQDRGGCEMSFGKSAKPAGVPEDPIQSLAVSVIHRMAPAL